MGGSDSDIPLFLIGSALTIIFAVVEPSKKLRLFLLGVAGILFLAGIFWPWVVVYLPTLRAFLSPLASSPWAWFLLLITALIVNRLIPAVEQQTPSSRVSWVAGLLSGFGVALGLYILFAVAGKPWRQQQQPPTVAKHEPGFGELPFGESPSRKEQPVQNEQPVRPVLSTNVVRKEFSEMDFWGQRDWLRFDLLSLPRPCRLKVSAPPEHVPVRSLLTNAMRSSYILRLGQKNYEEKEPCEVITDEKDNRPDKFPEREYGPQGIVTVSGGPSQKEVVEFLARLLEKRFEWKKVRRGESLPPDSPEDLIYIQIGPGSLR